MCGTTVISHIRPFRPAGSGTNLDSKKDSILSQMQQNAKATFFFVRLIKMEPFNVPLEEAITLESWWYKINRCLTFK